MNPFPIWKALMKFFPGTHACRLPTCQGTVAFLLLHWLDRKCWEQDSFLHSDAHSAPHTGKFNPGVVWLTLIRSLGKWDFHFPLTFQWTQHELPWSLSVPSLPQCACIRFLEGCFRELPTSLILDATETCTLHLVSASYPPTPLQLPCHFAFAVKILF